MIECEKCGRENDPVETPDGVRFLVIIGIKGYLCPSCIDVHDLEDVMSKDAIPSAIIVRAARASALELIISDDLASCLQEDRAARGFKPRAWLGSIEPSEEMIDYVKKQLGRGLSDDEDRLFCSEMRKEIKDILYVYD